MSQQQTHILALLRTQGLPDNLTALPVEKRWKPSEQEISDLIKRGQREGIPIDRQAVLRASRYLGPDSKFEERFIVTALVASAALAMGIGILTSVAEHAVSVFLFSGGDNTCEGWVNAVLEGAVTGLAVWAVTIVGGLTFAGLAGYVTKTVGLVSTLNGLSNDNIVSLLVSALSFESVAAAICSLGSSLFGLDGAQRDLITGTTVDVVWGKFGDGVMEAVQGNSPGNDPVGGVGVDLRDASGLTRADFEAIDEVHWSIEYLPNVSGNFQVDLFVRNEGAETLLATYTVTDADTTIEDLTSAVFLLNLHVGDDEVFEFNVRVTHGAATVEIEPGNRPSIRIAPSREPVVFTDESISNDVWRVEGIYLDPDGDPPDIFEFVTDGQSVPLSLSGDSAAGIPFTFERIFSDGFHTVTLRYRGAFSTIVRTRQYQVRSSSTPPALVLNMQSNSADLGEPIPFTVQLSDAAGPVPGAEIQLATDRRGLFMTDSGDPIFRLVSDGSGQASGEFVTGLPGSHTIVARDRASNSLDLQDIQILGGQPSDWTTEWQWTVDENTDSQARYDCQVRIQFQGQDLDVGEDVLFSANHGQFDDTLRNVPVSRVVTNTYTLTRAEADSGNEVITLDLPSFGVQLVQVTNLPVGTPDSFGPPSRIINLPGTSQENETFPVVVSDDGQRAARCSGEDVVIHDLSDLAPILTVRPNGDDCNCLDFSPDGTKLAMGDNDGTIYIIDVAAGLLASRNHTDGRIEILNLDWFEPNRIAAVTAGRSSSNFGPRLLFVNSSSISTSPGSITLPGADLDADATRVVCNAARQRCAASIDGLAPRWYFYNAASGSLIDDGLHPDQNEIWALAFNPEGTRFFVGGGSDRGQTWAKLFDTSSSIQGLPNIITGITRVQAAAFLNDKNGMPSLAVGGLSTIELFGVNGGDGASMSASYAPAHSDSYHLEFLPAIEQLAAVDRARQAFFNFGEMIAPSISIAQPPELGFNDTSLLLTGRITDSSGIRLAEYRRGSGAWMSLSLDSEGDFSTQLDNLAIGDTEVSVRAFDSRNNQSEQMVVVRRRDDTTAPLVSQVTADPVLGPPGTPFLIQCVASDSESGVSSVTVRIRAADGTVLATIPMSAASSTLNASPLSSQSYSATYDSTGAPFGLHGLEITATDGRGNAGNAQGLLKVDAAGDLDGNGTRDLLGITRAGETSFTTDMANWTALPRQFKQLVVGEFDGDGLDDIAGLTPGGEIFFTTDRSNWNQIPGLLSSLVAGDINADGIDDLAGLSLDGRIFYTTDLANWMLVPGSFLQLIIGDFDADGAQDLAGLSGSGQIFYTTDLANWIQVPGSLSYLISGDFDGNGADDLAGLSSDGRIFHSIDLNTWMQVPGTLQALVAGDFDGNGQDDLAGLNFIGEVFVSIDLVTWNQVPGTLFQLLAGDFDGDGQDDLAGLTSDGRLFVTTDLLTWTQVSGTVLETLAGAVRLPSNAKRDLDGDGNSDLIGLSADGRIFFTVDLTSWTQIPGQLWQAVSGDLNSDGLGDVAGLNASGQVFWTTDLMQWNRIGGTLSQLAVGDFNGDGRDDLAGLAPDGRVFFTTDRSSWNQIPGNLSFLASGDLDGDGQDDLAGLSFDGRIFYSLNLINWIQIPGQLDSLISGDFNGDGSDGLAGLSMDGRAFFTNDLAIWASLPGPLAELVSGDFDGDKKDELAGLTTDGRIFYSEGLAAWTQIPGLLEAIVTGDFDGNRRHGIAGLAPDGRVFFSTDLLTWNQISGLLAQLAK